MIEQLNNTICNIISNINNALWGAGLFIIVVLIGLYFTIRIKSTQIIHIVHYFKIVFSPLSSKCKDGASGKISRFQALSTALAASMGTGNIIGVATAISIGGPGAIFWMWVSALFGTSIGFIENTLGQLYKSKGSGPMGYISCAFRSERAALLYSFLCASAAFGIGNITQSNAISSAATQLNIPAHLSGLLVASAIGIIIFRGKKTVASVAEKLVPFAAVAYLIGALIVIVIYGNYISDILILIIKSAFGLSQLSGGFCGTILKKSITVGLRRGIFSNEAGLGSSVLVHAETCSDSAVTMGIFSVVEVVIDTLICCTATALVILLTGADRSGAEGLAMVSIAFSSVMGDFADFFVAFLTVIFAFCTLLGWYFYGEKCLDFTFGTGNSKVIFLYRTCYAVAAFLGAVIQLQLAWEIADLLNWFMLIINLTAVVILHNSAVKEINNYTQSINCR